MRNCFAAAFAALFLTVAPQQAAALPTFVNGITISGDTVDAAGAPGANQGRVGFFSDIYFDPINAQWWGLSDRGPGGGLISYDTRVQRFTLDVNPTTGAISNFQIAKTVKFTDARGNPFNGLAPNTTNMLGRAFDPEGFVINPKTGNFLVSDEYGPSLYEFNRNDVLIRTFATPANLIPCWRSAEITVHVAPKYAVDHRRY